MRDSDAVKTRLGSILTYFGEPTKALLTILRIDGLFG
jgi:hypothetical protein